MSSALLPEVVDRFTGLRVVVVGDALLDRFLEGGATRLSRDGPVPVVHLDDQLDLPGGAGNTAVNVAALGAQVTLVSAIGDDSEGTALCAAMTEHRVDLEVVADPERRTLCLHRVVADGHPVVRFDAG